MKRKFFALLLVLCLFACEQNDTSPQLESWTGTIKADTSLSLEETLDLFSLQDFYTKNRVLDWAVGELYHNLDTEQKIGQMIVLPIGKNEGDMDEATNYIRKGWVSGLCVFAFQDIPSVKNKLSQYQNVARNAEQLPLICSIDGEPGFIHRRLPHAVNQKFSHASQFTDIEEVQQTAAEIGDILYREGIMHNFAPVFDIGVNKSVIHTRAFGTDAEIVSKHGGAFIEEMQNLGVAATAKHFPGHGLAKGDSHEKLVYIEGEFGELDAFKSAIRHQVSTVMVGHIAVRNGSQFDTQGLPASISPQIIKGLLKEELGFKGIVVTDAMDMNALADFPNADLMAMKAGNDLVLLPSDVPGLISKASEFYENDRAFRKQVDRSVKKILRFKVCLGVFSL